ncbi:MAG TPA: Calx-beta domain-containing protein [Solirubrobacteraceae bacterium]|nr:Calx-beta domain-containing protein [Solirubrobacteraceae bacterium]
MHRHRWTRVLTVVALAAVAALVAFASTAGAAAPSPNGSPLRNWSVSEILQGPGRVEVSGGTQANGALDQTVDTGAVAFNLRGTQLFDRASGSVFSSATGRSYGVEATAPSRDFTRPQSARGTATHLDEYQAYVKSADKASLKITLSQAELVTVDSNSLVPHCTPGLACRPVRTSVRFHARAYASSTGGDFYDVGGVAYLEGRDGHWGFDVATTSDSRAPGWTKAAFDNDPDFDADVHGLPTGMGADLFLRGPVTLKVPLKSVRLGELFAVHVSLDAQAVDELGLESAARAFIRDPQHAGPGLLTARGLTAKGAPKIAEPGIRPLPQARCPQGRPRGAGTLQLSSGAFAASEGDGDPLVLVTRSGGSRGVASVTLTTQAGTATAGADYRTTKTTVRFGAGDISPRLVDIPLREDAAVEPDETFTVSLGHAHCAKLGPQRRATVTIVDDDQPATTPGGSLPEFTVGGTVDGLAGSGLVLTDQTTQLSVAGNGSFTFPGTFPAGSPYDVRVTAQPTNPDQVCTVVDGTGTVSTNVTNAAIHCANVATPTGLDASFGAGGRASTPGGGDARAVVVEPDGRIIVVGARDVGVNAHLQFGAAGYDAAGNLDPGFGTGGIATTALGGSNDKAFDAADDRDGGFVAVGRTDAAGPTNTDFGVARYTADGQPNPAFPAGGFVKTDVAGRADGANAVAVQPDGKIVAAGFAQTSPVDFDFALVRYNPDGSLDTSFGGDGIVTTDLGSESDAANGVAIQPDGKIVAVGVTGENIGLARYLPDGALDLTFGGTGTVVSDLGFDDVANGVAITSGGTILVAGTRLGPHTNLDPFVASYGPNGKLNLGFGEFGIADTDLSGGDDSGDDLVLDPGGGVVVVGSASSSTVRDMALVRYNLDGTLDTFLTTDFHGAGDFGHAAQVDPLGGIVAAGTIANGSENEFGLIRVFF